MEKLSEHHMACHECDLLIKLPDYMAEGEKIICPRCEHKITIGHVQIIDNVIAFSISALIILILSTLFSFLSFRSSGQEQIISFFDITYYLYIDGFYVLSVLTSFFIFIFPLIYLLAILFVLFCVKFNYKTNSVLYVGKLIYYLLPWVMTDVFLLGTLVALIKVISMAEVEFGVSFFSYVIFTVMFIYVTSIVDRYKLWYWVEKARV